MAMAASRRPTISSSKPMQQGETWCAIPAVSSTAAGETEKAWARDIRQAMCGRRFSLPA
ncbi:hypothetical protein AM571_PC02181 (plasmid) [Rhizobium etli 8C-3]|uniref:Uncharacterized protein n=1 Tax=Rhizobium etli 8C-3 TaxID=538025 RepID=A0A1L5PI29_RHIET|nr:hypothetical protein AM571_PC02181 [Rhizobium etli 8C-3]